MDTREIRATRAITATRRERRATTTRKDTVGIMMNMAGIRNHTMTKADTMGNTIKEKKVRKDTNMEKRAVTTKGIPQKVTMTFTNLMNTKRRMNSMMSIMMKVTMRNMEDTITNMGPKREVIIREDITSQDIMMTIMGRRDTMRRDITSTTIRDIRAQVDMSPIMDIMKTMERREDTMTIRNGDSAAAMVDMVKLNNNLPFYTIMASIELIILAVSRKQHS